MTKEPQGSGRCARSGWRSTIPSPYRAGWCGSELTRRSSLSISEPTEIYLRDWLNHAFQIMDLLETYHLGQYYQGPGEGLGP